VIGCYSASVIVATYERHDALRAVLAGLIAQTRDDFEVIVVDDGSGISTRDVVEHSRTILRDRLIHAWQPDVGFRLAAARNLGILAMRSPYAIFLDGDCVPRMQFVAGHQADAGPKKIVRGSRLLLSQSATIGILAQQLPIHRWQRRDVLIAACRGEVNRALPTLIPGRAIGRDLRARAWKSVRGCNFALWRADLLALGGFDESYVGWGHEDADLAVRAISLGLEVRRARSGTCVLHLWHPEKARTSAGENWQRLLQVEQERRISPQKTSIAQSPSPDPNP